MFKRSKFLITTLVTLLLLLPLFNILSMSVVDARTYVHGYYRSNGTYVNGYYRGGGSSSSSSSSSSSTTSSYSSGSSRVVNLYKGTTYDHSVSADTLVYVHGYYRADGTYVRPHYRTHPNNYVNDNFSYLGLSSLTPLQKYPSYNFNQNKDISVIENYLLYQVDSYNLSSSQLSLLSNYADLLNKSNTDNQSSEAASAAGSQFYKSLSIADEIANDLVEYDISAQTSIDSYIGQTLFEYKVSTLSENSRYLLQAYKIALYGSKENNIYKQKALSLGLEFYKSLSAYPLYLDSEASNQVNMDLLQTFTENANTPIYKNYLSSINPFIGAYTSSTEDVKRYIAFVFNKYGKVYNETSSFSYRFDLEYTPKLNRITTLFFQDGLNLYKKAGLSQDEATTQTIIDLILFIY
ncbi:hypothetical protein HGO21_08445 [Acinetobacter sp. CUI P1]|nr:hypothetical protein [Acinetobacter sp. CUI P1]